MVTHRVLPSRGAAAGPAGRGRCPQEGKPAEGCPPWLPGQVPGSAALVWLCAWKAGVDLTHAAVASAPGWGFAALALLMLTEADLNKD